MASATLGFGKAAESIDTTTSEQWEYLRRSNAFGNRSALTELSEVWEECRRPGWDGYGALPVERDTFKAAYCLLDSLPLGFPLPSIGAEPDGHLTLEWRKGPRRLLSVSVDPDGYLHFAGLFGTNEHHGCLTFFTTVPTELLQLIRAL